MFSLYRDIIKCMSQTITPIKLQLNVPFSQNYLNKCALITENSHWAAVCQQTELFLQHSTWCNNTETVLTQDFITVFSLCNIIFMLFWAIVFVLFMFWYYCWRVDSTDSERAWGGKICNRCSWLRPVGHKDARSFLTLWEFICLFLICTHTSP